MFQPNFVTFTNTDIIRREPLGGDKFKGNQNDGFSFVTFADGSGGLEKSLKDWTGNKTGRLYRAEILAAQEFLAARVGEVMNAPVRDCRFTKDATTIVMPFVEGKPGNECGEEALPNNPQSIALKLFDYLVANADRRPKNWIITSDGRVVGIDHALANFRERIPSAEFISALWNAGVTIEALIALRPKLDALKPHFQTLGMTDKHDTMMSNLNSLMGAFGVLSQFAVVMKDTVGAIPRYEGTSYENFVTKKPDQQNWAWLGEGEKAEDTTSTIQADLGLKKHPMSAHKPLEDSSEMSGEDGTPLQKGDKPGHDFHGNQYKTVAISQELAHKITTKANAFYAKGGTVANWNEMANEKQTELLGKVKSKIKSTPDTPSNQAKLDGLNHIVQALEDPGYKVVALNEGGEIVGAVGLIHDYEPYSDTEAMAATQTYIGSDGSVDGTASALEHKIAQVVSSDGSAMVVDVEPQARGYHEAMGRNIVEPYYRDEEGIYPRGWWTPEQVKEVANLPVNAPTAKSVTPNTEELAPEAVAMATHALELRRKQQYESASFAHTDSAEMFRTAAGKAKDADSKALLLARAKEQDTLADQARYADNVGEGRSPVETPVNFGKGDVPGHPFHGNQWETVASATPEDLERIKKLGYKSFEDYQQKSAKAIKDFVASGSVAIKISNANLNKVLRSGRYKSAVEVGEHKTGPDYWDTENKMFGFTNQTNPKERPNYGFIDHPNSTEDEIGEAYGRAKIILKDEVKDRTTVTIDDSNATFGGEKAPVPWSTHPLSATDPQPEAIKPPAQIRGNEDYTTVEQALNQVVTSNKQQGYKESNIPYVEAQIFGGVRASDIARVEFSSWEPPSEVTIRLLEERGIPYSSTTAGHRNLPTYAPITKGDKPGHLFHGNQYTEGSAEGALIAGDKVKSAVRSDAGLEAFSKVMTEMGYYPYPDNQPMAGGCGLVAQALLKIYPQGQLVAITDKYTDDMVREQYAKEGREYFPFVNHYAVQIGKDRFVDANGEQSLDDIKGWFDKHSISAFTKNWIAIPVSPDQMSRMASVATGNDEQVKSYANALLEAAGQQPVTKGDLPGHPFHGNQYIEGVGGSEMATTTRTRTARTHATKLPLPKGWSVKSKDASKTTLISKNGNTAVFNNKGTGWKPGDEYAQMVLKSIDQYAKGKTVNFTGTSKVRDALGYVIKGDPNTINVCSKSFVTKYVDYISDKNQGALMVQARASMTDEMREAEASLPEDRRAIATEKLAEQVEQMEGGLPVSALRGAEISSDLLLTRQSIINDLVNHELGHSQFFDEGHHISEIYPILAQQTSDASGGLGKPDPAYWETATEKAAFSLQRKCVLEAAAGKFNGMVTVDGTMENPINVPANEVRDYLVKDGSGSAPLLPDAQMALAGLGVTKYGSTKLQETVAEARAAYFAPPIIPKTPLTLALASHFGWDKSQVVTAVTKSARVGFMSVRKSEDKSAPAAVWNVTTPHGSVSFLGDIVVDSDGSVLTLDEYNAKYGLTDK